MRDLIAKKYIKGLFQTVKSEEVPQFLAVLTQISNCFQNKKFVDIVTSPYLTNQKKEDFLVSLLEDKSNTKMVNFLRLLAQKGRIELIPDICKEIQSELSVASNRYNGYVLCNSELSQTVMDALSNGISKKTGSSIALTQKNADIDGIVLRVEDLGIEVSFSKERLKSSLTEHILKAI